MSNLCGKFTEKIVDEMMVKEYLNYIEKLYINRKIYHAKMNTRKHS